MGLGLTKIWDHVLTGIDAKILLVGLDSAGKTTILSQLNIGETVETNSINGFNVENLEYRNLNVTVFNVGENKIRVLWKHYYQNINGLIYVVDSNDKDRIEEACDQLKYLLDEEELKDCVVLVLANKQDLSGALSPNEITQNLGLQSLNRRWLVQGT